MGTGLDPGRKVPIYGTRAASPAATKPAILGEDAAYGYRIDEVTFPDMPILGDHHVQPGQYDVRQRMILQRGLCFFSALPPPMPDVYHSKTIEAGVNYRVGRRRDQITAINVRKLRSFTRRFCFENLDPIPVEDFLTEEQWLESSNYNEARKAELRKAGSRVKDEGLLKKDYANNCFGKVESYCSQEACDPNVLLRDVKYKHARGIYSRSDKFKAWFGPIAKSMENAVFKLPDFIKHTPQIDRPKYIHDRLYRVGAHYICTDHTSFESSISPQMMECIELQVYNHLLRNHPDYLVIKKVLHEALASNQKCYFRDFTATLLGRMSGEMVTSLGNGLTNLISFKFIAHELGWSDVVGVVEGDDGLFAVNGSIPTPQQWAELGFLVKMEMHDDLSLSTFCQVVYDSHFRPSISPLKAIITTCWTDSKYRCTSKKRILEGLLLAKILSLKCRAWCNPVIWAFGSRVESFIQPGTIPVALDSYWQLNGQNWQEPDMEQRLLCEVAWGVTIPEQLYLERLFLNMTGYCQILDPVALDIFDRLAHGTCSDYGSRFRVPFRHTRN